MKDESRSWDNGPIIWVRVAGVVAVVGLIVGLIAVLFGQPFTSTDGGTVAVIRNGGWLDTRDVRQIVPPASALTPTGFWSSAHKYSAAQRYFVVSATPNADSNEVIDVPSKDGVHLGIEGTFYFYLNQDTAVLTDFDNKFGVRTYPVPRDNDTPDQKTAYDGEAGWKAFLNSTLGNLVQNDLRQEVLKYRCSDLISSCALAQNGANPAAAAAATAAQTDQITAIQDAVNKSFQSDVVSTLGGPYFTNIKFVLSKVALPPKVQTAIDDAQSSFGAVTAAQAALQAATVQAQANKVKQDGYNICRDCAEQDNRAAIPKGITVWAPGAGVAVAGK